MARQLAAAGVNSWIVPFGNQGMNSHQATMSNPDAENGGDGNEKERASQEGQKFLATLTAQLLPPVGPGGHDTKALSEALSLASRLLEEASRPRKEFAYELFCEDAAMTMREVAETFEEYNWEGLVAPNTIAKYTRLILDDMHRQIEIRRALLSTASRHVPGGVNLIRDRPRASRMIKNLLVDLGMARSFGADLEFVVERTWNELSETWLKADGRLREEMARLHPISPSMFSEICIDVGYNQYVATRCPKGVLKSSGLLDVIRWLDGPIRKKLLGDDGEGGQDREKTQGLLALINHWPDYFFPGDWRYSNPFAECIVAFDKTGLGDGITADVEADDDVPDDDRVRLERTFDSGIDGLATVWAKLKLRELAKKLTTASAIKSLEKAAGWWDSHAGEDGCVNADAFVADPADVIDSLARFLRGEQLYLSRSLPLTGELKKGLLKPFLRDLESLLLDFNLLIGFSEQTEAFGEPDQLHEEDGWKELMSVREALRKENASLFALDKKITEAIPESVHAVYSKAEKIIDDATPKSRPGQVNAHLLFRYAAERGILNTLLTRRRPSSD